MQMSYPNMDPSWVDYQRKMDDGTMRTLVILHRVYAGVTGLLSCCFGGYLLLFLGVFSSAFATAKPENRPPPGFFGFFAGIWVYCIAAFLLSVVLNLLAANWLRDRRNWVGVTVVSALNCLSGVLGIALAVFTLVMINRPHIRETFE